MTCAAGYDVSGGTGNIHHFWGDDSKCRSSSGQGRQTHEVWERGEVLRLQDVREIAQAEWGCAAGTVDKTTEVRERLTADGSLHIDPGVSGDNRLLHWLREVQECRGTRKVLRIFTTGYDCWAGNGEQFACAAGFESIVSEETMQEDGLTWHKYTCLPLGHCNADKCTSPDGRGGHDCWANVDPTIEPATCERFGTASPRIVYSQMIIDSIPHRHCLGVQGLRGGRRDWSGF